MKQTLNSQDLDFHKSRCRLKGQSIFASEVASVLLSIIWNDWNHFQNGAREFNSQMLHGFKAKLESALFVRVYLCKKTVCTVYTAVIDRSLKKDSQTAKH